jgi:hypothetical protein
LIEAVSYRSTPPWQKTITGDRMKSKKAKEKVNEKIMGELR